MKIVKTASLDLETVNKIESLITTGKYKTFSSFIQKAANDKLEKE